ncbi:MAG: 50S ribosomal protein L25/general stress protein Ctc [Gammaproteobacteria bacterium]|nr:50S ribosomal protein L25/general stress protein Ctc [Gammaproteobacteria bacterium]
MSSIFELTATARADVGRGASRRLRRSAEKIPAILYGADKTPVTLTLNHFQVTKALKNEAFYSHILTLDIEGTKQQAVLKAIQRHPYKPYIQHMDFLRITGKEKIRMTIPLHFSGEEVAPGIKDDHGIVSHLLTSVDVFCLPKDLPEYIAVDLSNLKLDESVHLSHLSLPAGVELVDLTHGHHDDKAVASIHIPRAALAEEEAAAPVAAEVPAINQTDEPAASEEKDNKK